MMMMTERGRGVQQGESDGGKVELCSELVWMAGSLPAEAAGEETAVEECECGDTVEGQVGDLDVVLRGWV